MRPLLTLLALLAVPGLAAAETIGFSFSHANNTFNKALSDSVTAAATKSGVTLKPVSAENTVDKQISDIAGLIADKVDALVVKLVSIDSGLLVSRMASDAGIPLVYVNAMPNNIAALPPRQAFVGSDEKDSGTLEFGWVCDQMKGKGTASFLIGDLRSDAARQRTLDYYALLDTPRCSGIKVMNEAFADWSRDKARDIVTGWIAAGHMPDAIVSNNDDMALGALEAFRKAGLSLDGHMFAGVDATPAALDAAGPATMT